MGVVADAACAAGGEVTGVITPDLAARVGHDGVYVEVVETLHQRKQRFADLADGYIALPGGFGTLEELFEAATWNQLGIQDKPTGLLNVGGYFDGLLSSSSAMSSAKASSGTSTRRACMLPTMRRRCLRRWPRTGSRV